MKKYQVTKFYYGIYICGLVFILLNDGICAIAIIEGIQNQVLLTSENMIIAIVLEVIGLLGLVFCIYLIFFDLPTAKFSVNSQGITMYIRRREYCFLWNEFVDYGFTDVSVEAGADTYWVYFSKEMLSYSQKQKFLSKTRRDNSRIAYFQYQKSIFDEVISFLPTPMQKTLKTEESLIALNLREKLFNK